MKAEARKAEEVKAKNIQKVDKEKEKVTTIEKNLKGADVYNSGIGKQGVELLGFQPTKDDDYDRRDGYRGGRGGRYGGRGGKFRQNAEEFPTL